MIPTKIELAVVALSGSESQPGNYTLVLSDFQQKHRIPIIIGAAEAQAIAMAMENLQPTRPLTHDLLVNTLQALGASLQEVLIEALQDGIFCALLTLRQTDGATVQLAARTSDAVALAVRVDAPIFIYEHVMEEAGIMDIPLLGRQNKGSLADYTLAELEELLRRVVEKEDYESAVRIRVYLEKRRRSDQA